MNATYSLTTTSYPGAVDLVLLVVRLCLGLTIFAHGYQKFFLGGRIAGTAGWFDSIGMRPGKLNALAAATTETGSGVLMTLGLLTPLASAGIIALMCVAIFTVHFKNGFFNFRKGQGIEYNVVLAVAALVPATIGAGKYSLDHALHPYKWSLQTGLLVTIILGVGGAVLQLAAFYRPPKQG
jgi:putative oxidoreductase